MFSLIRSCFKMPLKKRAVVYHRNMRDESLKNAYLHNANTSLHRKLTIHWLERPFRNKLAKKRTAMYTRRAPSAQFGTKIQILWIPNGHQELTFVASLPLPLLETVVLNNFNRRRNAWIKKFMRLWKGHSKEKTIFWFGV